MLREVAELKKTPKLNMDMGDMQSAYILFSGYFLRAGKLNKVGMAAIIRLCRLFEGIINIKISLNSFGAVHKKRLKS